MENLGEVSKGNLTMTLDWIDPEDAGAFMKSVRNRYDPYGNITAIYDPLWGQAPGHYRTLDYDSTFYTFPVTETIYTGNSNLPSLVMSATYDPGLGVMESSTDFNGFTTRYGYDTFGRLLSITKPGDSVDKPTVEYDYLLAHRLPNSNLINWVETRQRETAGGGTVDSRVFYDGMGRKIMTRAEGENPGQIVITDTVRFNARKSPWKKYLPYFEENSTLDFVEPTFNTGYAENFYDAPGREIRVNQPIGPEGITFATTTYTPLTKTVHDEEQTRINSPHYGCGMRYVEDGLQDKDGKGRLREVYEIVKLSDTGEPLEAPVEWRTTYTYDLLDKVTGYTDSQNNRKFMLYDGLGRMTFMNDPDRGYLWQAYDDAGNLLRTRDAKGQEIAYAYDGINRLLAEYYTAPEERLGNNLAQNDRWTLADPILPNRDPDVAYHYDETAGPLERGEYWETAPARALATTVLNEEYHAELDVNQDGQLDVADVVKTAQNPEPNITVTAENTKGFLAWVRDQSGEEHTSYDARGRPVWSIKRIRQPSFHHSPTLENYFASMEYDSMDRVLSLTYPDRTVIAYSYNSRGLLESVSNVIARLDYNPSRPKRPFGFGLRNGYE